MSHTPVLTPGPGVRLLADFDGRPEGVLISTQFAGVTFSQALSGSPRINNYPWLYGYGSRSGGVLTGSTEGGYIFPTIAGLVANFASPAWAAQFFFSDTAPLDN